MYDIFISYSHSFTAEKAEHLYTILESHGFAGRVSLDKDNLSGKFDVEILRRIDNCKDLIIILSESTFSNLNHEHSSYYKQLSICPIEEFYPLLESLPFKLDYLRLELARAIAQNKNVVPIAPARNEDYNFDDFKASLPEDIKFLGRFQSVFYDDKGSLTFQDIIETKVIGKDSKTLLQSVPKLRSKGLKGILAGLLVVLLFAIGILFFRDFSSFQRCTTIEAYEAFIDANPLFLRGKAESDRLRLENILRFDDVKSDILSRIADSEALKRISYNQAEALSSILTNMVHVKGGDFLMGSDDASLREAPKHRVEVDDFYICRYECSVAEWYGILGETCNGYNKDSLSAPIVNICWDEAMAFVVKLNEILPGAGFALPHEKEWEYAAAGGCLSVGCEYSGGNDSSEVAWTLSDSLAAPQVRPSDGISWWKESNELGIFNMSGNVAEFCENRFYYYSSPQKEFAIDMKVIRGGSFTSEPVNCRIFSRDLVSPEAVSRSIGFRLVLHLK